MTVIVDFTNDWKQYVENEISSQGYTVDQSEDLRSLSYKFFNLKQKNGVRLEFFLRKANKKPFL